MATCSRQSRRGEKGRKRSRDEWIMRMEREYEMYEIVMEPIVEGNACTTIINTSIQQSAG
eukprot:764544-Hanusia_phi.AAC.1